MGAVSVANVKWGKYREWAGPYWPGSKLIEMPNNPDFSWKVLSVLTATETKGFVDSVNMYDRMIISISPIQWGESGQYSVSNILGLVAERDPIALFEIQPALAQADAGFEQDGAGKWRFRFRDERGWVDSVAKQQQLFWSTDGKAASWGEDGSPQRIYAKTWAACVASTFHHSKAIGAMFEYTLPRLYGFAMGPAKTDLFAEVLEDHEHGYEGAIRAMYISYAGNNPAKASQLYTLARSSPGWAAMSTYDRFFLLARHFTTQGFDIWGRRYDDIAPALESAFDIDIPQHWQDL